MKRLLGILAVVLVVEMFALPLFERAPKAISDMTTLDCTVPSPYAMYDEMCPPASNADPGTDPSYTTPDGVSQCIGHASKPTWSGGFITGGAAVACNFTAHIYVSGSVWRTTCGHSPPGQPGYCPVTIMGGGVNPDKQTCDGTYCESNPYGALWSGCNYYWSHLYTDISGFPDGHHKLKGWSYAFKYGNCG